MIVINSVPFSPTFHLQIRPMHRVSTVHQCAHVLLFSFFNVNLKKQFKSERQRDWGFHVIAAEAYIRLLDDHRVLSIESLFAGPDLGSPSDSNSDSDSELNDE